MACTGPSKDFAYKEGEKAFNEIMDLLAHHFYVRKPLKYPQPEENAESGLQTGINEAMFNMSQRHIVEWNANTEKLKQIIQEIVWADHANAF